MKKRETIHRLCELVRFAAIKMECERKDAGISPASLAADCFCGANPLCCDASTFQMDERVIAYIWDAVQAYKMETRRGGSGGCGGTGCKCAKRGR